MTQWWSYKHIRGSVMYKRFFCRSDIAEARCSPFVKEVFGPFNAINKEMAELYVRQHKEEWFDGK